MSASESNTAGLVVPRSHLAVIEHPCIIKNVSKGIVSLGGDKVLDEALVKASPEAPIELSLRPDDVWAKRTQAGITQSGNVVLRVTVPKRTGRKRKRGSDEPFEYHDDRMADSTTNDSDHPQIQDSKANVLLKTLQDNPESYSIAPIGTIEHIYRFRNLPDFQYASSTSPLMTKLKHTILTHDYQRIKSFDIDPTRGIAPGLDVGPPPVANLMKVPYNYSYRQNVYTRITTDSATGAPKLTTLNPITHYTNHVIPPSAASVPSESPVPLEPEANLDLRLRTCIAQLRAALAERPIMAKRAQENLVRGASDFDLRRAWPYVGYMFSAGPFRDAIVRFGVDPRTEPACAPLQTLWFQIPGATGYGRRGVADADVRAPGARRYLRRVRYGDDVRRSHVFDGEVLYRDGKTWQLCDVVDPLLKSIVDEAPLRDECDEVCGWYGNGTWSALRMIMKEKIANLAEGRPRNDELFKEILATIPAFLTPDNVAVPPRSAGKEFVRISGLIRTSALHYLRKSAKIKATENDSASLEPKLSVPSEQTADLNISDDGEEDIEEEDEEEEEDGDMDMEEDENQSEVEEGDEMPDD